MIFQIGRTVMPIFGFVLAYNLARPNARAHAVHSRMMYRLSFWGLIVTPMVFILNDTVVTGHAWWPLNIRFMLLLVVALICLIERGGAKRDAAAVALFLIAGAGVEFLWFGVASCLGAWGYWREPTYKRLLLWAGATLSLSIVNGTAWVWAAIPVVVLASRVTITIPRVK